MIQDMLPFTEEHFDAILRLIRYGRAWCQGSPARDKTGRRCLPHDEGACKWCIGGAIAVIFPMGTKYRYFTEQDLAQLRLKNDRPMIIEEMPSGRLKDKSEVWPMLMDKLCEFVGGGYDWRIRYSDSGPKLVAPKKAKRKLEVA